MKTNETQTYVDVILPLALPGLYTYQVPPMISDTITPGSRVIVQFGKSKLYSAVVRHVHDKQPQGYHAKPVESVLEIAPIVEEKHLAFWEWVSQYYMCTIGEVMNAALPTGLKISSETYVVRNTDVELDTDTLTDKEFLVSEALEFQPTLTLAELSNILNVKNVYPVIKSMLEKGALLVYEAINEKFKPKKEQYLVIDERFSTEKDLQELFDSLSRAPRQLEAMMKFAELSQMFSDNPTEVSKKALRSALDNNAGAIQQLVKKEVFTVIEKERNYIQGTGLALPSKLPELSEPQTKALSEVKNHFTESKPILLHGITSSGKTEIYAHLINEAIQNGKQVLYLLPEIALTTQLISRLSKYFGDKIAVYHSRYNLNEKVETWRRAHTLGDDTFQVVLGARSALFLPFHNLGLIIVDEEHDGSFKQQEQVPRYHARDAAIMLAKQQGAQIVLGSATPSIESFHHARSGKYGYVELNKRFGRVQLPQVNLVDIKDLGRKRLMKSLFSPQLIDSIATELEKKQQVILFQNRRGFAPFMECDVCGWIPHCTRCDVRLTYHKLQNELRCHYCGYRKNIPHKCESCGNDYLQLKGFGTEKIEDELQIFFPAARIARMDLDTTRRKNALQEIIFNFEDREIDILVGTQMVTKGLDFSNVSLVGILNADSMLYYPDFRAFERSFQLMTQVSGRAGRKAKRGQVLIQTRDPLHTIIQHVVKHDYQGMFRQEMIQRKKYHYPPYFRLVRLTIRHKDLNFLNEGATHLAQKLSRQFGRNLLGPEFPPIPRIRNLYHKVFMIKLQRPHAEAAKLALEKILLEYGKTSSYKSIRCTVDVDPI